MKHQKISYFKHFSLLFILSLLFLLVPTEGFAWGNLTAHPTINDLAEDLFFIRSTNKNYYSGKYQYTSIDREFPDYTGLTFTNGGLFDWTTGQSEKKYPFHIWLERGGYDADEPELYQSKRHFYDPVNTPKYLTDQLGDNRGVNPKIDAKTWALSHPDHQYSWNMALRLYKAAMENDLETYAAIGKTREALFAASFRAVGETMHLVADMACVPHVRNDSHPYSEPIEDFTPRAAILEIIGKSCDSYAGPNIPAGVITPGMTPEVIIEALAKYTNSNFFSADTITDSATGITPNNGQQEYPAPQLSSLGKNGIVYYASIDGKNVGMCEETLVIYICGEASKKYHITSEQTKEQTGVLIPLAVVACSEVIDSFFPAFTTKLETITDPDNPQKNLVKASLTFEKTNAWTEADLTCSYNGPAEILVNNGPTKVAFVMKDGIGTVPGDNFKNGDKLTLQLKTGARQFTTEPLTYSGEIGFLAKLHTTKNLSLKLTGVFTFARTGGSNKQVMQYEFWIPNYTPTTRPQIAWDGASFSISHSEQQGNFYCSYSISGTIDENAKTVNAKCTTKREDPDNNEIRTITINVTNVPCSRPENTSSWNFDASGDALRTKLTPYSGKIWYSENYLGEIIDLDWTGEVPDQQNSSKKGKPTLTIWFN